MRLGSLFAGIGGFDLAAQQTGIKVAWAVEIDERARAVLAERFPDVELYADITELDPADLDDVELLTGGSPCQNFSIAGNRQGLDGKDSGLFSHFVRFIDHFKERGCLRWAVWENVVGALSSNKGTDFANVLGALSGTGLPLDLPKHPNGRRSRYAGVVSGHRRTVSWRVLDAQHFGLAQRRKRVFAVVHLGGRRAAEVLLERQGVQGDPEASQPTGQEVAQPVAGGAGAGGASIGFNATQEPIHLSELSVPLEARNGRYANAVLMRMREGKPGGGKGRYGVRRLTPVECERLQGFPDGWTDVEGTSDSARYKQLGNAVAVPVVAWLLRRLVDQDIADRPEVEVEAETEPEPEIHYVLDPVSFGQLVHALTRCSEVAYDIETTGLDPDAPEARVVSASFSLPGHDWVVPLSHPEGPWGGQWAKRLEMLAQALASNDDARVVAHNAKFDLRWTLTHTGVDLTPRLWWDTMMSAYVLDENLSRSLKNVAVRELEVEPWGIDVRNAEATSFFTLARYNALDTRYTLALAYAHRARLGDEERLARVFKFIAMPTVKTLGQVELEGILVDLDAVEAEIDTSSEEVAWATSLLGERAISYGMNPDDPDVSWEPTANWFRDFTTKAAEVGDLTVLEMTPAGRPSWRRAVLTNLSREGSVVATWLLAYRKHSKRLQFLTDWRTRAQNSRDGRIRASFNPMRTVTGRLSSSDPNMQQVSRDLKHVFAAEPGWFFVEADYSQIELRIAAQVSGCEPMLEAFNQGRDLHRIMASIVSGVDYDEVTPEQRQRAKAVNFGFLYGMGPSKFVDYSQEAYDVTFTQQEAADTRTAFFDTWTGLHDWHERMAFRAARDGYVTSPLGRRRRLPEIYSDDEWERWGAERQAINAPVQSMASDLMLLSMDQMRRQLDREHLRLVGTVHDSCLLEVNIDHARQTLRKVGDIMVNPPVGRLGARLKVPLEVEFKVGYRWSDERAKTFVYPKPDNKE